MEPRGAHRSEGASSEGSTSSRRAGFMVVHGNRLELLRELVVTWIRNHPLNPLDSEIVLVQSNGIAQWLKLGLARNPADGGLGISGAVHTMLPQRFVWSGYRAVLGEERLSRHAPFDSETLVWRLMRLWPSLISQPAFAPISRYLENDADLRKQYQLSLRVAALFQQYQMLRAEWLSDWEAGRDRITVGRRGYQVLPLQHGWQAQLWRALLTDAGTELAPSTRSATHGRFLDAVRDPTTVRPNGLPERIIVFGLSSIPVQSLEAIAALGRWCEVLMCVLSPSRHDWSELIPGHDSFSSARRRFESRPRAVEIGALGSDAVGHPLLGAWGRQGRDLIRLLDTHDDRERYAERFSEIGQRIELFEEPPANTLLNQLQSDLLDLRPPAETRKLWPKVDPASDPSIRFHICHSLHREVEVLHDQLLAAFVATPDLQPRDVLVMVPDISDYAPHIHAVFGRFSADDPRRLPFTVADQDQRQADPIVLTVERLLKLPSSRLAASEVLDLLEVPSLRRRFGISETDLERVKAWTERAGIRWGLNGEHLRELGLESAAPRNTWEAGLARMLLGYAAGEPAIWQGIAAVDLASGMEASLIGCLARLIRALGATRQILNGTRSPEEWSALLSALLDDYFDTASHDEGLALQRLSQSLLSWADLTRSAGFKDPIPLSVVREHWLSSLDSGQLSRPFITGGITFATLTPMRSIPYRVIALMGMSDENYPRQQEPADFDLIAHDPRPGDRSRREDDRYLFLEALLSARDRLMVSWVGRSATDNEERPPSVVIAQLRDHIERCWQVAATSPSANSSGKALIDALTVEHPLQPFSSSYFSASSDCRLFSYAREWLEALQREPSAQALNRTPHQGEEFRLPIDRGESHTLALGDLKDFLGSPAKSFLQRRLRITFPRDHNPVADDEPFALDSLTLWRLTRELLNAQLPAGRNTAVRERALKDALDCLALRGELPAPPIEPLEREALLRPVEQLIAQLIRLEASWPLDFPDLTIEHTTDFDTLGTSIRVIDTLLGLRSSSDGRQARFVLEPGRLNKGETKRIRPEKLVGAWVEHLAAHLSGASITTFVVSSTVTVRLDPLSPTDASHYWQDLLSAWLAGQQRPLPAAPRTAFAWLSHDGDRDRSLGQARQAYEGETYTGEPRCERDRDAYLRRAFPDFDALWSNGEFEPWTAKLYAPIARAVQASEQAKATA
jgi:exodeoxyribonuclease V gamma subunit